LPRKRYDALIATDGSKQIALLTLLHAVCQEAVQGLQIAENAVDEQLLADLERMVERTRRELEVLNERFAKPS
jgi:hypothetical protein